MRKISKSNRTDDDVISSANGSIANDENDQVDEAEDPSEDAGEKDGVSETNDDVTEEQNDNEVSASGDDNEQSTPPKKRKIAKQRGRKKKSESSKRKSKAEKKEEIDDNGAEEEEYEVDKVVDSKKIRGKLHYLIRWKGYSASSDTWEPEDTLSCPDLINKFNDEKENSKSKSSPVKKTGIKRKGKVSKSTKSSPAKKPKTEWDSKNADENAEYEVERILEVHHKKNGKREFLIHWKGWSNKFDSWEPENHLNCPDLIKKFMDKVENARGTESRSLRVAPGSTQRFTLQDPSGSRRLSKRRGQRQRVRYDDAE